MRKMWVKRVERSGGQKVEMDAKDFDDLVRVAKAAQAYVKDMELAQPVHPDAKRLLDAVTKLQSPT